MPIPPEILAVDRPKNTVVQAYGKNGDRFLVKQRTGCKYVNGRRVPVNGPVVGHIVDGIYVPKPDIETISVSFSPIELKDWAAVALCDKLFSPMIANMEKVYCHADALKLYCIAVLRVCFPGIKDYELKDAYDTSFLSVFYPNVGLSRNVVSKFLNDVGKACSKITAFMRNRAEAINMDHHLLVDGTLKSDESRVNSLSDFSRKARTKGTRDISVLYAFDLEAHEPVCSKCFPGNMLDLTSYEAFIADNGITKGIIVADKGFPSSAAEQQFSKNPDLHYLNPVKRNAKIISSYELYDYDGILPGTDGVLYKKAKYARTNKWFYSYRNPEMAAKEEKDWLKHAKKNGNFSFVSFQRKQKSFGTAVLESDLDLTPAEAYKAYASRWEIELVMRFYKSACEFDETREHDDYSVIASEFCDFLSSVLTFRLLNTFDSRGVLEKNSYKRVMSLLRRAKKVFVNGQWKLIKISPSSVELLQKLELLPCCEESGEVHGKPDQNGV